MNPTPEESADQRKQGIVSFLTGQQVPVKDDILVSGKSQRRIAILMIHLMKLY